MSQRVITAVLATALATGGTVAFSYPTGKTRGDFILGTNHYLMALQSKFSEPVGIGCSFGATTVTVTYRGTTTIPAGSKVIWTNRDDIPHTIVSDTKAFRSKALDTDDHFEHLFDTPGTYPYVCSIHPHMTGAIIVK